MIDDQKNKPRVIPRHPIAMHRFCSVGVITFRRLDWIEAYASVIDLSVTGVGIESDTPLEPGFVWFKDRVGGHRGGVLMWSLRRDGKYRAGIKFVPLSRDEERYIEEQIAWSRPHRPVRDPESIINAIIDSLKKDAYPRTRS